MTQKFLELIDQIDAIESKFHNAPSCNDFALAAGKIIHDLPEFQIWIQEIQFELQEIIDVTSEQFAIDTLEAAKEEYDGWNDEKCFRKLKSKLLVMKDNIDKYYSTGDDDMQENVNKPPKIFISHSSKDKEYVSKLVELLVQMGLDSETVFCTSLPGYGIPIGSDICSSIWDQFHNYNLYVFFIHSKNYYESAVSLNEMGAAWALKNNYISFLLPGFNLEEMAGVVDKKSIAIKLDNDPMEVGDMLNQLYENIVLEFDLKKEKDIIWEQARNRFISEINAIGALTEE